MASQMKSAGKRDSNWEPSSNGWWNWAAGIAPESNQASSTGSTRRAPGRSHVGQAMVTSSTYGPVQVELGEVASRPLGELGHRADARVGAAVVAAPDRQRRAPVPVA